MNETNETIMRPLSRASSDRIRLQRTRACHAVSRFRIRADRIQRLYVFVV